jgi:hypothetical protein
MYKYHQNLKIINSLPQATTEKIIIFRWYQVSNHLFCSIIKITQNSCSGSADHCFIIKKNMDNITTMVRNLKDQFVQVYICITDTSKYQSNQVIHDKLRWEQTKFYHVHKLSEVEMLRFNCSYKYYDRSNSRNIY